MRCALKLTGANAKLMEIRFSHSSLKIPLISITITITWASGNDNDNDIGLLEQLYRHCFACTSSDTNLITFNFPTQA